MRTKIRRLQSICKQTLAADIQAKLQANHGVLNAKNMVIMECLGLADSKELIDMFFNLLIEKQDLQVCAPPKSPFKPTIVPVPKCKKTVPSKGLCVQLMSMHSTLKLSIVFGVME